MMRKLLFLLTCWSALIHCTPQSPNDHRQTWHPGLKIENGINRGVNYTDPLGTPYSIRYIPITITNYTTISLTLRLAFAQEYNYPVDMDTAKFHVIPLPGVWGMDGVEITDSLFDELPRIMGEPVIDKTLAPGEKCLLAIGTVYPRPAGFSGVLPNTLFTAVDQHTSSGCDWLVKEKQSPNAQLPLRLKLKFGKDCRIIPAGYIAPFGK